ncbi:hypothetical protein BDZ91DRAFT_162374 [Kalaharituber pfeilii]|nr:hypothetical protein BDZ91DRAFT_162374 [Kalaharituber pfeilii]
MPHRKEKHHPRANPESAWKKILRIFCCGIANGSTSEKRSCKKQPLKKRHNRAEKIPGKVVPKEDPAKRVRAKERAKHRAEHQHTTVEVSGRGVLVPPVSEEQHSIAVPEVASSAPTENEAWGNKNTSNITFCVPAQKPAKTSPIRKTSTSVFSLEDSATSTYDEPTSQNQDEYHCSFRAQNPPIIVDWNMHGSYSGMADYARSESIWTQRMTSGEIGYDQYEADPVPVAITPTPKDNRCRYIDLKHPWSNGIPERRSSQLSDTSDTGATVAENERVYAPSRRPVTRIDAPLGQSWVPMSCTSDQYRMPAPPHVPVPPTAPSPPTWYSSPLPYLPQELAPLPRLQRPKFYDSGSSYCSSNHNLSRTTVAASSKTSLLQDTHSQKSSHELFGSGSSAANSRVENRTVKGIGLGITLDLQDCERPVASARAASVGQEDWMNWSFPSYGIGPIPNLSDRKKNAAQGRAGEPSDNQKGFRVAKTSPRVYSTRDMEGWRRKYDTGNERINARDIGKRERGGGSITDYRASSTISNVRAWSSSRSRAEMQPTVESVISSVIGKD